MTVRVQREGVTDTLPAAVDLAAYRIVQEALTNTLRHAAARPRSACACGRRGVREGPVTTGPARRGIRPLPQGGARADRHAGARRLLGGSLRAGPLPGGGFEVAARLPVEGAS